MVPCEGRQADTDALVQAIFSQIGAPGPGRDSATDIDSFRVESHFVIAQKYDGSDVAFLQLIFPDDTECRVKKVLVGKRHLNTENDGRLKQPVDMFLQAENGRSVIFGIVATNAFEDPEPVMQGMGEDMDIGFVPGDHFSIHPDFFRFFQESLFMEQYLSV